jgi:periplasmic protein CpxP/Spy
MRSSIKALLGITAAAALAATAASSVAQEGPPPGGRPGIAGPRAGGPPNPQMREQMMRERLALRPEQEPAFQTFLQATQPPQRGERREIRQLTTPERLDRQLAELRQRVDATKRFYAVLSPAQRQTFDSMALGGPDGGRGPGRGGGRRAQGFGGPDGAGQGFGGPPPQ